MAKHPHLLELVNHKTWRCVLDGCSFFVHIGLAYVLPGKSARCWKCNEVYVLTEDALKDNKPICDDCRLVNQADEVRTFNLEDYMKQQATKRQKSIEEGHSPNCDAYIGGVCTCVLSGHEVDEIEIYEPEEDVKEE